MNDLAECLTIVVAMTFVVVLLLAIAFDMPAMAAAVLVAAVAAGCVEYYARIRGRES